MHATKPARSQLAARLTAALLLALPAGRLPARDDPEPYGPQPKRGPQAAARYAANMKACQGNPDVLVLPGLVADRKAREVRVLAESTGLDGREAAEFLLVGQDSSHGYEALLWSMAKPSDVHRALVFIGLKPGSPAHPLLPRLRPDGDRVMLRVREEEGTAVPIEQLILDTETGETLPEEGFVFAGSMTVQARDGQGAPVYVADETDARSVASIFSDRAAVLDVPRHVEQGEAYGRQVVNPEAALPGGKLLTVIMEPAARGQAPLPRRLQLLVDRAAGATSLVCRLSETNASPLVNAPAMSPVLEKLVALKQEGVPPVIVLSFGDGVAIADVSRTCALLAMLEAMGHVHVEAPEPGQLYYRAFVPAPAWLKPEERPSQPWELHLNRHKEGLAAEMAWNETVGPAGDPSFKRRVFPVATPLDAAARLNADRQEREAAGQPPLPPVLLIFAPGSLRHGELMAFIRPVLNTHPTVYVFAGK